MSQLRCALRMRVTQKDKLFIILAAGYCIPNLEIDNA